MTRRPSRRRTRNAEGFTLIELLVALTLLGLIAVVSFGGLRFGARAWETGSQRAADINEVEAVQNFLRRQMSRMMLLPDVMYEEESEASLRGEATEIRFLATIPPELGVGGIALFHLYADFSDGTGRLAMDWLIYRPDGLVRLPNAEESRRSLIDGIAGLKFRYFGPPLDSDEAVWTDRWDDRERLPDLITLDIQFPNGDSRRWPGLSVAPKLAKFGMFS